MVTIYDLLEVSENATKSEIENAYEKLIVKYQTSPNLSEKENKDNEFVLNKLKLAYEILTNDEKRKKYDKDLAQKRAEALLQNVTIKPEEPEESEETKEVAEAKEEAPKSVSNSSTSNVNRNVARKTPEEIKTERYDAEFDDSIDDVSLTAEEQKRLKQAAQEEFQRNLKKVQQAEAEYNQAYEKAYKDYMKKMSSKKMLGSFKKIKNTIIILLVTIIVCFIAWHIPPVKAVFVNLYNENQIIKILVDIVGSILKGIVGIFKK